MSAPSLDDDLPHVQNHGGGSAEAKEKRTKNTTHRGKPRQHRKKTTMKDTGSGKKQYSQCYLVKTSPTEGWRRFQKNTAYVSVQLVVFGGCSSVEVFVLGSGFLTLWKIKSVKKRQNYTWSSKTGHL